VKIVATDKLIPYARNPRTHSDAQVSQIAASIKEFGFLVPVVVDEANGIIAGHGRVLAAQRRAFVIADNKLTLNADWDEELLSIEMTDLRDMDFNLDLTGFSYEEIGNITKTQAFNPSNGSDQGKLDQLAPTICPECGHEF
jgi:ParB family chromosome partitioning protein